MNKSDNTLLSSLSLNPMFKSLTRHRANKIQKVTTSNSCLGKSEGYPLLRSAMIVFTCVISPLSLTTTANAQTLQNYVIHTYGGAALIPAVRQQLEGTNSSVTSYQDKLIVHTTIDGYAQVQRLLRQIDGAPKSLTVSMRVGTQKNSSGNIGQTQVKIENQRGSKRPNNNRAWTNSFGVKAQGKFGSYHQQSQQNSLYQVKILSGKTASIGTRTLLSLAQNYIVIQNNSHAGSASRIYIQGRELVPTKQGIQVVPRTLSDGQIQIQINQQDEQLTGNHRMPVDSQHLHNTIIVSRGVWTSIGTINQSSSSTNTGLGVWGGWNGQMSDVVYPIQIRVD